MNNNEIVNEKLEIIYRFFVVNETRYSIVGTGLNTGIKDTVVNMSTGKRKTFYRSDLKKFLVKNEAVKIY